MLVLNFSGFTKNYPRKQRAMSESRRFYRHPTEIPIVVRPATSSEFEISQQQLQQMKNVSLGGLAFESQCSLERGTIICVGIDFVESAIQMVGKVAWCRPDNGDKTVFLIGVEFTENEAETSGDIVEGACQLEVYKDLLKNIAFELTDPLYAAQV